MKESIYNFFINSIDDNIHLVYNAFRNTLINDDDCRIQDFIKQNKSDLEFNPEYITKEEYQELISSGIIVSDDSNEKQTAIDINHKRLEISQNKNDKLSLVITPTLRCNFKCYYCFESTNVRKNEDSISIEVQEDIINFITKSIIENPIKELAITWYGGEPLIQQNIVFSMQEKIYNICESHNVKMYSDIITNGILLSPEVCDLLYMHGIKRAQVTIDGPEHLHNKRRYYPVDPENNYQLILENLLNSNDNIQFDK